MEYLPFSEAPIISCLGLDENKRDGPPTGSQRKVLVAADNEQLKVG
jgi:hypothetical protein